MEFTDLKTQYNNIKEDIQLNINNVLNHGKFILGPEVNILENELSKFISSKNTITTSSGTDSLLISLMAIGIKPGDEIITTPFTFISPIEVIVLLGATPVFVDIEEDTCLINAEKIEEKISKKTKAIIPVSLYGQCPDFEKINKFAKKYNLTVIEDGAQSFGAKYYKKYSGNLSKIGCTSFFPSKPLGCYGDGGAIFTNNNDIAEKCREIRAHGQKGKYNHIRLGIGGRLDTIQAAVLISKLKIFKEEIKLRKKIGDIYNLAFDKNNISRVKTKKNRVSVYGQYTIFSNKRKSLSKYLTNNGIPSSVHYPNTISDLSPFEKYCSKKLIPNASIASETVLSIPMSAYLSRDDQEKVINKVIEFNNLSL